MIQIKNVDKWVLPAYRNQLFNYDTRFNVYYGGAGSGKSYFVCQKLLIKALQDKRKVLVIRKVGSSIKDSIWSLFVELLYRMPAVIASINKTDKEIVLVNGSTFIFKGLDDSEKIKSINGITDIVIEEATELTLDDFTQLNLRLRANTNHNQIHLMFNPVSKVNWCYKYFFEFGTPADTVIIHTTYHDNPYLPKEYVDSLHELELRNPAYYKIYVLGEFATLDKLVFNNVKIRLINTDVLIKNEYQFWVGMDFGYVNDPTAITYGFYNPDKKQLFITGEYNGKGLTNDKIAEILTNLGLAKEVIVADSAEPKSIDELRKLGIRRIRPSVKGRDSVINGIDKLQRCEIIVDERCVNTIEEFQNYTWKKDKSTGEYTNQPVDLYNHHIDSIRYGTQTVISERKKTNYESLWVLQ